VKKFLSALGVLAIAALGAVALPQAAFANGTINGTITDLSNVPIAAATVGFVQSNGSSNAFTGAGGTYTASQQAGTYLVQISAVGFATEYYNDTSVRANAANVVIADGTTTVIDAALAPESTITGTVTDNLNNPVVGATVFVYSEDESWQIINSTQTAAGGAYSVGQLAPGHYKIWVRQTGDGLQDTWFGQSTSLASATQIALAVPGSSAIANVQLPLGAEIDGTVTDPLGSPVKVSVTAVGADGNVESAATGVSGDYSLTGLIPEAQVITAHDFVNHFFNDLSVNSTASLGGLGVIADFSLQPRLPLESEFFDIVPPISGPISVEAGKTYTWVVHASGQANVFAILYSSPVYLGAAARNPDDSATLTVTIPLATSAGAHKFTFSSYDTGKTGGTSRSYFVIDVASSKLAATGTDSSVPAGIALLALLSGAGALFIQRRTRRH